MQITAADPLFILIVLKLRFSATVAFSDNVL